eukprot:CAMPEP_0117512346 /NCGR_PEP_ID=MMETSP0784-20121206/28983_1 /TAXON_ID=39447 /ORGANISM="" /LENGTH=58 /DNA_ID=CAMNT_0005308061 /DNA_START=1402 /DNA_END=1578 /DNA_ORIENTATION=+
MTPEEAARLPTGAAPSRSRKYATKLEEWVSEVRYEEMAEFRVSVLIGAGGYAAGLVIG